MPQFQIPKQYPTTNKSVRFPDDIIENVEKAICGTGCTFSRFVIEAVRSVLEPSAPPDADSAPIPESP